MKVNRLERKDKKKSVTAAGVFANIMSIANI